MLQMQDLTIVQDKDLHTLIEKLNVTINIGDKVAIIGEEGTGKSTLLQYIYHPEMIVSYASVTGKIVNHFKSMAYLPQILPKEDSQLSISDYLYKDIDYNLFDFNLLYQLATTLHFDSQRFADVDQTVAQLSGGEKIKLQLLKLLAQQPDLLLLDEPSSDLDMETMNWLEKFIAESPLTIIFISHDETLLSKTATHIIHLEQVKKGNQARSTSKALDYKTYINQRQDSRIKQERIAKKEREKQQSRLEKLNRTKSSVRHNLAATKNDVQGRLLAKKMKNILSQEKRFEREEKGFTELPDNPDNIRLFFAAIQTLPAQKILLNYQAEKVITGQIIDFTLKGQEKIALIGPNGIGKTTLIRKIYQDLQDKPGVSVGYMPQEYSENVDQNLTALEFLSQSGREEEARTLLAGLKFTRNEILHPISHLSGGQKAKLFLAKMVFDRNNILLLDEPTRHFSPSSQPEIRRLLQDYPGAIFTISHDRTFIEQVTQISYQLTEEELIRLD
ncbi:ATP-binding cassette domain-containing protein [Streptococcus sobrinus]|uniref:ATP-binding cassette domain-containing protein n=1 Tax=Streptococcus sobrinus TaxID=1310 RepID=UPI0039C4C95E